MCSIASFATEVSVLTCTKGDKLYSAFGHTALRIVDDEKQMDQVYNFGVFDFDTPYFYLKFLEGNLKYQMDIVPTDQFVKIYKQENQTVYWQKIWLSEESKQKLQNELETIYTSERRYYPYSFLHNNCATKVLDLLYKYYPTSFSDSLFTPKNTTFRELLNETLNNKKWIKTGVNLLLGNEADQPISKMEASFLPRQLSNLILHSPISDGGLAPVFQASEIKGKNYWEFPSPFNCFLALFVVVLLLRSNLLRSSIFILIGIMGLILLNIVCISNHPELNSNYNLLFFNPLFLIQGILSLYKPAKIQFYTSSVLLVSLLSAVAVWIVGIQYFELEILPLFLLVSTCLIRSIVEVKQDKRASIQLV